MPDTLIDYLTRIWSPVTGCTAVSPGCDHCYARALARRWKRSFVPTVQLEHLADPMHWRKPQVVGVGFHGDLFHDSIDDYTILTVFTMMAQTPQHTYVVPTKRARRMADFLERMGDPAPANIWWLASVEDQARAEERIPELLRIRGCTGVSLAPQIGPVDLDALNRPRIGWVVQECESGPGRRPFDVGWARSVRDACKRAGVPYYLKQRPMSVVVKYRGKDLLTERVVKQPELDGVRHLEVPWQP